MTEFLGHPMPDDHPKTIDELAAFVREQKLEPFVAALAREGRRILAERRGHPSAQPKGTNDGPASPQDRQT